MFFFFFNDTATTEIYTLSLHDALPISGRSLPLCPSARARAPAPRPRTGGRWPRRTSCGNTSGSRSPSARSVPFATRSEEHTSELQSRQYLVCRLLLEKKKTRLNSLLAH